MKQKKQKNASPLAPPSTNVHIDALELEVRVADVGACGVERVSEVARWRKGGRGGERETREKNETRA